MPPKKDADSQLSEANARLQTARDDAATFREETLTKWHEKLVIEQKLVDANMTILRLEKRDSDTQKQLRDFKGEVEEVKKNEHEVKERKEAVKKREEDGFGNDVAPEGHVPVRKRKQVGAFF
jgi:hypothetical protein